MALSRKRPLSDREIRSLTETASVGGAPGLECVVSPKGTRSWRLLYRVKGDPAARRRSMGLGRYPGVSLAEARLRAEDALRLASNGEDPQRVRTKKVREHDVLFADCMKDYLAWCAGVNARGTVADKHSLANNHLLPAFGDRPVRAIDRAEIVALLDRLGAQPARRRAAYSYLRHFFQWAVERDLVAHNPCLAIRSPRVVASRDRVLTEDEIRALWKAEGMFAHISRLSLLTAQRRGSIEQMRRDQIDFAARIWSIPATGMKSGRAHDVPLSDLAIVEINAIPPLAGPYVFGIGSDGWKPYAGASNGMDGLRIQLYGKDWRGTGQGDWRTHDLRRTAVTLAQREGCSIEEIRALTQHRIPGVIGVYARHAYTHEKRKVVESLARRLTAIVHPES
ncbi:MAG: integrase family protein [Hyphomonadaceae bacterium]